MKELLFSVTKDDFKIIPYKASGAGGQHRNKTMSAIKIIHEPSGAIGQSCDERSQHQNKQTAFKRLTANPKFKIWLNRRIWEEMQGRTIEQQVDSAMREENLKIEMGEDIK